MEEDTRNNRVEAQVWCAGTLVAAALLVYTAWHSIQRNEGLAREMQSTEQVAPTPK